MKALIAIVLLAIVGTIVLFVVSTPTTITIDPVKVIGAATPVTVRIANPHGVRRISARISEMKNRIAMPQNSQNCSQPIGTMSRCTARP